MKKARKILLYFFLTLFLFVVILIVIAALSEDRIAKVALTQVSKSTNIPIQVDDIEFSLVRNFPYATIRCKNLQMNSLMKDNTNPSDTLLSVQQLYVSVEVKPLLKSIFKIRKVEIDGGEVFYHVDTAGVSNFDFLMNLNDSDVVDTSANVILLNVKDFTLENTICHYQDEKMNAKANLLINRINLSGAINREMYSGKAEGNVVLSECAFDTTQINLMRQAKLNFELSFDKDILTITRTDISIDEDANLMLHGTIDIDDSLFSELTVNAEKLDLKGLSKYIPGNYLSQYGINYLSGILSAEAQVSGALNDSVMPYVDLTYHLSGGNLKYQDYPELSRISLEGKATNGSQKSSTTTSVDINSLNFQAGSSRVSLSGKFRDLNKISYDLKSNINLNLKDIEVFVPDSLVQSLDGMVNATITTKGTLPDSITDEFIHLALLNTQATLKLSNVNASIDSLLFATDITADVEYHSNQVLIKDLKAGVGYGNYNLDSLSVDALITGDLTKPDSLDIQLHRMNASLGNSKLELNGTVKYPFAPEYSVSGKINLNLAEIRKFVPDSLVNQMSGKIMASFNSSATLNIDSVASEMNQIVFEKSNFSADFNRVEVITPDSLMSFSNLTGSLRYDSDTIKIQQLDVTYQGLQLGMNSVTAAGVYSAAIQNQPKELSVHGNFRVDHLDYALLETFMQEDSTDVQETSTSDPMNFTYKINGRVKANSVKYEDAFFQNINSKFLVKDSYYVLDSLAMDAFDGSAVSSIKIEMKSNDEMDMFFKTNINKMDVAKMIESFGEYIDYEDIQSENVQGLASTQMDGKIVLKNFEPVYESLMLDGDLTIENGALINVKPVMEIEKIPAVGLKGLDKLYFNTLNSSLFLFNNELYVPRTEIRTSSFDAMFLGMYSFGEDYEYHIRMFLGEVLSSKSKANLKKQAREGGFEDEDEKDLTKGRTSIYVVSKSEDGKEKAGFDNKRDRLNMAAKVNLQKQMVDMRFHPSLIKYNTEE